MALRVLLADESSTIKKVFQLALQDFAVEVRPVNIGVDVAMVAGSFKPDIVFADVLLQKKNGYDVCAELKADAHLRGIPVVLMWSGFMELDEDKFQASQANAQLEKPFDVQALRKLVTDLVPRTQNQSLSQFLTFPKGTVEADKRPAILEPAPPAKVEEDFTPVSIPKMKGQTEKYRLNMKPEELESTHIAVDYELPDDQHSLPDPADAEPEEFTVRSSSPKATQATARTTLPADEVELDEDIEEFNLGKTRARAASPTPAKPAVTSSPTSTKPAASAAAPTGIPTLTAEQVEKIIRAQSVEVIEAVVWKVIPELAAQIIERELQKLLHERDSRPY